MRLPGIWPAIAVRTSASVSLSSFTNAGTRSLVTTSSSTAFAIWGKSASELNQYQLKTNLLESVCNHISNSPTFILNQTPQRGK